MTPLLRFPFTHFSPPVYAALFGLLGLVLGFGLARWIAWLTDDLCVSAETLPAEPNRASAGRSRWKWIVVAATGVLFGTFVCARFLLDCQDAPEVQPVELWIYGRVYYHLMLIALLVAATGCDFREYVIPDGITLTGVLIGLGFAVLSGDLQTIHIWSDWNVPLRELRGAYIPLWIKSYPHWHGLAWSMAGMVTGAGMTWLVRVLSKLLLRQAALGLGDVTLMAMIGSFLGWQPVVIVFLLAPLCAVLVVLPVRLVTGKSYIPYGPCLSAAAVIVLFTWKWWWRATREIFGHPPSLAILAGVALTALVLLLGLLRLYRLIPVDRRSGWDSNRAEDDTESNRSEAVPPDTSSEESSSDEDDLNRG